jgi:hypothetical protein
MPLVIRGTNNGGDSANGAVGTVGAAGADNAERQLVAAMLNMELGARAYAATDTGVELLPGDAHAPWPLVTVPPATARGRGYRVHYRPAVGVIYYSGNAGVRSRLQLAGRLSSALEAVGSPHLQEARLVSATPVSMLRVAHKEACATIVTGPRRPFCKPLASVGSDMRPARLIQVTPEDEHGAPPHYSARAVFTWLIMPLSALVSISALAIGAGRINASTANALQAGIVYDTSGLLAFASGDEPALVCAPRDCADAASAPHHCDAASAPVRLPPVGAETVHGIVTGSNRSPFGINYALRLVLHARVRAPVDEAHEVPAQALAAPAPRLIYCGNPSVLTARKSLQEANGRVLAGLRIADWDAEATAGCGGGARGSACALCRAPIGGAAVTVGGARRPRDLMRESAGRAAGGAGGTTGVVTVDMLPEDAPLASDLPGAPTLALICLDCWRAVETPAATFAALKATVCRVTVPWSQAEAARALGMHELATILEHPVAPLETGAFLVDCTASGGPRVVLAGATLGPWPALDYPAAMRGCYLIPGLNLITDRR